MRLDRLATLYFAKPIQKLSPLPDEGCIRILMYHRVSDLAEPGVAPYFQVNTSPRRFAEQMLFLHENRYKVIELNHALKLLESNGFSRNHVVITFDDAYADFAENAWPVLEKFNFPATVYVPTGMISNPRRQFKSSPCLNWTEIKTLRKSGVGFGSHTVSHPELHKLPWPAIEAELRDSKARMENEVGETIKDFAYPYAYPEMDFAFVNRFTGMLRECGYASCVTTRIGIAREGDSPFSLKRLPINNCDDLKLFQAKLDGSYNWLALPQRLRKLSWRKRLYDRLPFLGVGQSVPKSA